MKLDANPYKILETLSQGNKTRNKIPGDPPKVYGTLRELSKLGLVVSEGGIWKLSDKGKKYMSGWLRL